MPPNTPGPGTYNVNQKPQGPSFSISGRLSPARTNENPGPGTYTPQSTRPNSPAFSIGYKGTSSALRNGKLPGPGTYDPSKPKKGPSFSFEDRSINDLLILSRPSTPGPGSYDIPSTIEGPSFSLGDRASLPPLSRGSTPGPATYKTRKHGTEAPSYSFGTKLNSLRHPNQSGPGPGRYDAIHPSPNLPSHSFGKKLAPFPRKDSNPGPGTYDCRLKSSGPKFSLLGRLPPLSNDKCGARTGPGSYTVTQRPTSPSFSLGGRISRPVSHLSMNQNTPGPGSYNPKEKKGGPAYSLTGKPKNRYGSDNQYGSPGPGAYNTSSIHAVGKDAPSYSLTSKPQERRKNTSPGPGSYTLPKSSNGPAFSLKSKTNYPPIPDIGRPGPGEYNPNPRAIGPASPSYGMGRRLEKISSCRTAKTASPGPGAYNTIKKAGDGPAFSIFPKLKRIETNINPGPGAYDASLSYSSNCPKSPAYSLGTGLSCSNREPKNLKKTACRGPIPCKQVSTKSSARKSTRGSEKLPQGLIAQPSASAAYTNRKLKEKTLRDANAFKPSKPFKNP